MHFTWFYVTHVSIFTSDISSSPYNEPSASYRTFCYRSPNKEEGESSSLRWVAWAPLHFRCKKARPVSYYAFFKGWLLPSPPPGCHCFHTSFPTEQLLRDLSGRSGLFPFWLWTLAPKVCLLWLWKSIRSFLGVGKALGHPYPLSALPLFHACTITLYLNRFRRKPAISEFDWLFTPTIKSSPSIATDVGSVLQNVLPLFQPAQM